MAEFELYRYSHADGSSKDWAIRLNGDGSFTTRWGRTGSRLPQDKTKPLRHPDEVHHLKQAKRRKGYELVGRVQIDAAGNLLTPIQGVTPATPPVRPRIKAVYWSIELTNPGKPAVRDRLGNRVQSLIGLIKAAGDIEASSRWDGWRQLIDLTESDALVELSGKIRQGHGVIPLLFLLALRQSELDNVQIGIAGEEAREIGDLKAEPELLAWFGTDLESVRPLAEALELLQPRINLTTLVGDNFYF
ncbi:WGR domain-containing protein [Methylococcus sp. EFPC2]|uniref:WGR domain-containing protein n=1 Tax=Methylococcus sp. EFPC2 TaxID=2812648 RepID=UPI00196840A0|nr:WGR domain-containing protein [Methylococcus sp. EFPC2]QSA98055.1 WGR domain-containing protein [Methylococcus sp. EFPC2]